MRNVSGRAADADVFVLGGTTAKMLEGLAVFNLTLQPTFVEDPATSNKVLKGSVFLSFEGSDAVGGSSMLSSITPVVFHGGGDLEKMCPVGSVLEFDKGSQWGAGGKGGKGRCVICGQGEYAASPFKCGKCPDGLNCRGGTEIFPRVGFFAAQGDIDDVLERFSAWEAGDEVAAFYRDAGSSGDRRAVSGGVKSNETKRGTVTSVNEDGSLVVNFKGATHVIPRAWVEERALPVWPCPVDACLGGSTFMCKEGRHGMACGLCNHTVSENGTFFTSNGAGCVVCEDDQSGTVAAMTLGAVGAVLFLALTVWRPLVGVWSCWPSGASERAFGESETLQVNQNPEPETRNLSPEPGIPKPGVVRPSRRDLRNDFGNVNQNP